LAIAGARLIAPLSFFSVEITKSPSCDSSQPCFVFLSVGSDFSRCDTAAETSILLYLQQNQIVIHPDLLR